MSMQMHSPLKPIMHCHSSHDTSSPSLNVCISQQADYSTSKALAASSEPTIPHVVAQRKK